MDPADEVSDKSLINGVLEPSDETLDGPELTDLESDQSLPIPLPAPTLTAYGLCLGD